MNNPVQQTEAAVVVFHHADARFTPSGCGGGGRTASLSAGVRGEAADDGVGRSHTL